MLQHICACFDKAPINPPTEAEQADGAATLVMLRTVTHESWAPDTGSAEIPSPAEHVVVHPGLLHIQVTSALGCHASEPLRFVVLEGQGPVMNKRHKLALYQFIKLWRQARKFYRHTENESTRQYELMVKLIRESLAS